MFVLGGLLVVAGALVVGFLFLRAVGREPVIVMTRDVPMGTRITQADLGTTMVAADSSVPVIPEWQAHQVVGRLAAVDLRKGTLVEPAHLTTALSPGPGQQVVAIAIKDDQLPSYRLGPGDPVLVVATPGQQGQDDGAPANGAGPLPQDTPATVDQVSGTDADGNVRVALIVDARVGPAIIRQASTGRIGLALTARGPR